MNGHQLNMFASKVDLAMLMRAVELKKELQYVHAGLFDVYDLAAQGQDRLIEPVSPELGVAAGALALNNEQLALG